MKPSYPSRVQGKAPGRAGAAIAALALACVAAASPGADEQPAKDGSVVKIASISFVPTKWDKEANWEKIDRYAREAAAGGADVVLTCEGQLEGYLINVVRRAGDDRAGWERRFFEIAEPDHGPWVAKARALADELNVHLVLGYLENDNGILYNTAAWIDRDGRILHRHRKTHMAQPYYNPGFYHPGREVAAFDTEFGRCGLLICYERQVPEVTRALALDGARLVFNPSYGSRGEWNDIMLRTRARENGVFFVFTHPEQTLVIAPDGAIIENVADREGVVYADLDPSATRTSRLERRRPEVFLDKLAIRHGDGTRRSTTDQPAEGTTLDHLR